MKTFFEPEIQRHDLQCLRNDTVEFLHEHLGADITRRGHQGEYMMPVKNLASRLEVAPQTLHKVYDHLSQDGLLFREPGKRLWQLHISSSSVPCLGLILPTSFSVYFPLKSSFGQCHFRMYSGLVERAAELGYSILPIQLPPPEADAPACLRALLDIKQKCRGVIHLGSRNSAVDRPLQMLADCNTLPQVSLDCTFKNSRISSVSFDARQTIHLFLDSMMELGHRRFAFIRLASASGDNPLLRYNLTRASEIARYFMEEGIAEENLVIADYSRKNWNSYRQTISELLSRDNPPTAFLCRNDDIAIELMQIIREEGFRVPEDFSVMGFNNLNEAETSDPPLSTIGNPLVKLGAALADQLHRQIHCGGESPPPVRIAPVLIPRASTGACLHSFDNH